MLNRMNGKLGRGTDRNAARHDLAEFLWVCIEAQGSLVVDKEFLKQIRIGRTRALMALCDLLLAERIHLRSDAEGRTVAMSNFEFMRFILNQVDEMAHPKRFAKEPAEVEISETVSAESEDNIEVAAAFVAGVVAGEGEGEAVFSEVPPPMESEDDWFAIDVATDLPGDPGEGTDLPGDRQTLPERKREPWLVFEQIEEESVKNSEK